MEMPWLSVCLVSVTTTLIPVIGRRDGVCVCIIPRETAVNGVRRDIMAWRSRVLRRTVRHVRARIMGRVRC